jgi:hypothetical protein
MVEGAAASASLLCLVHCLALPFILLMLPGVIGLFASSEAFHHVALGLVFPSALAAFWLGYRRHRAPFPALLGIVGIGCLVAGLLPGLAEGWETAATVAGSLLLIAGHALNWRLRTHAY